MVLLGSVVGGNIGQYGLGRILKNQGGGSWCRYRYVFLVFALFQNFLSEILVLGWLVRMITCLRDLVMRIRFG